MRCPPCGLQSWGAITALGDARETALALAHGRSGLTLRPVLGVEGGEMVPLACLMPGWELAPKAVPAWTAPLLELLARIPSAPWGDLHHPVFVTGSNFGIDSILSYHRDQDPRRIPFMLPEPVLRWLQPHTGWGGNVTVISHACVSASLGLAEAAAALTRPEVQSALVVSFDFLSPFVTGGFHALKILNENMPAPFAEREFGAIGLGDGAAFVVLEQTDSSFVLAGHAAFNEMYHFTANDPSGHGFEVVAKQAQEILGGRRAWIKGHGTGTLEAGALEAQAARRFFPDSPLVSWKGAIGHTLGSCGLVELAIAVEMLRSGSIAGTVGSETFTCPPHVATKSFDASGYDAVVLQSNAFGGAHATTILQMQ